MKPTKSWIQTLEGKACFPIGLTPDMVSLHDIPVALSRRNRFSGQTLERVSLSPVTGYSVAQHCVVGSRLIAPPFALAFLLHELSEVYLPDVANPIKPHLFVDVAAALELFNAGDVIAMPDGKALVPWRVLEAQHADVMMKAIGLASMRSLLDSPEVKTMDVEILAAEKKFLMGPEPMPWALASEAHPGCEEYLVLPMGEQQAKKAWIDRFFELTGRTA